MTGADRFIDYAVDKIRSESSVDKAILMARFLGEVLWKNATGHYQLADLERELIERLEPAISVPDGFRLCRFGHVLTKAYDTGGHTRVVERLVVCDALQDSAVLVTEAATPKARGRLAHARHGYRVIPSLTSGRLRIAALVAEFVRFETLILYIHPYDIESVIAAGIARKRAGVHVLFFNHADHVFSYGYSVAERVLEISHFGWAMRAARSISDRSVFVGIPLALPPEFVVRVVAPGRQRGFVATAGTAYKFRPALGWSFPAFVHAVCRKVNCRFEVLGPNRWRDWWWWPVMWSQKDSVAIHARLEHEEYRVFISGAAAYVDSFPMVGGTAFAEVIGLGVPSFGVLTGSHGYSPADLVKSSSVDELVEDLARFMNTGVRSRVQTDADFAQVQEVHDAERVAARIVDALSDDVVGVSPPWPNPLDIDTGFYERMWQALRFPVIPVNVLPPLRLLIPFLLLKGRGNA